MSPMFVLALRSIGNRRLSVALTVLALALSGDVDAAFAAAGDDEKAARDLWQVLPVRATDAIAVAGIIPAAVAVYAAGLWALRIEERDELAGLALKMLGRLGIPVGPQGR